MPTFVPLATKFFAVSFLSCRASSLCIDATSAHPGEIDGLHVSVNVTRRGVTKTMIFDKRSHRNPVILKLPEKGTQSFCADTWAFAGAGKVRRQEEVLRDHAMKRRSTRMALPSPERVFTISDV